MSGRVLSELRGFLAGRLIDDASSPKTSYLLAGALGSDGVTAFAGTSRDGVPSVLFPLELAVDAPARLTSGLAFWATGGVEFSYRGKTWFDAAAIIECRDPALLPTFTVMVAHVIESLPTGTRPSWATVANLFDEWERMLRRRRVLGAEDELGLWGELRLIAGSPRLDDLIAAWQGPEAEAVDFVLEMTGFEVKTTRRSGVHFISQTQVERPLGELALYFVACDVVADPVDGRSLAELVGEVSAACADPMSFERKLLAAGFSRADSAAYGRRYLLTRAPWLYPQDTVPRVRSADPGVSQLRYRVELDPERALAGDAYESIIRRLSPGGTLISRGTE